MYTAIQKTIFLGSLLMVSAVVLSVVLDNIDHYIFIQEIFFISTLENEVSKLQVKLTQDYPSNQQEKFQEKNDVLESIINSNKYKNYKHSLEIAETFLIKNNLDNTFLNARAEILLQMGNYSDAISNFKSMNLSENSSKVYVLNNLAVSHILNKDFEVARNTLDDVLDIIEESEDKYSYQIKTKTNETYFLQSIVTNNLAITLIKLEKYDEATDLLKELISFDPRYYSTYNNLAAIFFIQNNILQANEFIKIGLEYNPNNKILINNLETTQMLVHILSGFQKLALQEKVEGQQKGHLDLGVLKVPPVVDPCKKKDVERWIIMADDLVDAGLYDQAIEVYKKALCDKSNTRAKVGLAYALLEVKQYAESRKLFNEVLFQEPNNLYAKTGLGYLDISVGKFNSGISLCQEVIDRDPNWYQAYNCIGEAQRKLGNYQKSIVAFQNSTKINSEKNRGFYGLGIVYLLNQQLDFAIENLKIATKQYPNDIHSTITLARAHIDNDDIEESKEVFSKINNDSKVSKVINLADCYASLVVKGQEEKICFDSDYKQSCESAVLVYRMAEELAKDTDSLNRISNGLGFCYREMGEEDKAKLEYCKTLKRTPDDSNAISGLWPMRENSDLSGSDKEYLSEMCTVVN